mmetsp:Transcript_20982/g.29621  ORF Transcript_20982/g.29621 Transcript_20982/m.29621 type:complete len:288 (+) Transcript_20982:52-915(+)
MTKVTISPECIEKDEKSSSPKTSRRQELSRSVLSMFKTPTKTLSSLRRTLQVQDINEESSSSPSFLLDTHFNFLQGPLCSRCLTSTTAFIFSLTGLILTIIASYVSCDFVVTENEFGIGIFQYQNITSDNMQCIPYTYINETAYQNNFNSTQQIDPEWDHEWKTARILTLLTLLGGFGIICLMMCALWTAYSKAVFHTFACFIFFLCFLNSLTFIVLKSDICSCIRLDGYNITTQNDDYRPQILCEAGECDLGQGGYTMIAGIVFWLVAAFFLCLIPSLEEEYADQW